jgi:transposase
MMTKARRQYSREFKQEAVQLLGTSGKSASQLERELGIGQGNLWRWKREFAADGKDAFPGQGRLTPEQERLRRLERELEIVRQERDILKKAVAIFSRPSPSR